MQGLEIAAAGVERTTSHTSLSIELVQLQVRLQKTEQREIALTIVLAFVLLQTLLSGSKKDRRSWWMYALLSVLRLGKYLICVGLLVMP